MCGRTDGEPFWQIHWYRRIPYPWRHIVRLELDHVTPVHVDYELRWEEANFQPLCNIHNERKGTRTKDYRRGHYPAPLRLLGALLANLLAVVPFTRFGSPAYQTRCRFAAHAV